MSVNDGGPAFPMTSGPEPRVNTATHYNEGMSLLDYFAGQALAGLLASQHLNLRDSSWADIASDSFSLAKHMLAERAKRMEADE